MASKTFSGRRKSAGLLDISVATLAAGAVAFLTFAMPADLFASLVVASRLPDYVSAAQPPLGATARLAAVAGAGLFTFAFVFSLLRALDRAPARKPIVLPAEPEWQAEAEAPRLRRADAHPDAPARRPLLAVRELGEPDPEDEAEDALELTEAVAAAPLPAFLLPEQPEEAEPDPAIEIAASESEPEPAEAGRTFAPDLAALSAALPEAAEEESGRNISKLMQRLERGLARRGAQPPAEPRNVEYQETQDPDGDREDRVGHSLRSAINELQKIAAQSG